MTTPIQAQINAAIERVEKQIAEPIKGCEVECLFNGKDFDIIVTAAKEVEQLRNTVAAFEAGLAKEFDDGKSERSGDLLDDFGEWVNHHEKIEKERDQLQYPLNLLALIHGDDGHYTAEHGIKKSTDDAMKKRGDMVRENEQLKLHVQVLREALAKISDDAFHENRESPYQFEERICSTAKKALTAYHSTQKEQAK